MLHSIETREELIARIDAMKDRADQLIAEHYKENGFSMSVPTHSVEIGIKWAKIWTHCNQTSIYAFVAMSDFQTKELGQIKRGDIHKAATYKAPAKHARGNVAQDDFGNCLTCYGIQYLR